MYFLNTFSDWCPTLIRISILERTPYYIGWWYCLSRYYVIRSTRILGLMALPCLFLFIRCAIMLLGQFVHFTKQFAFILGKHVANTMTCFSCND
jgi:hypothetical protein